MNHKKVFLAVLMGLSMCATPAWAMRINNPRLVATLASGEVFNDSIELENNSDNPISINVYLQDFVYNPPFDGEKTFLPPKSVPSSLDGLVEFSPKSFSLQPGEKQKVSVTMYAGSDLQLGKNGVLFFETLIGKQKDEKGVDVDMMGRVGALLFLKPVGKEKNVSLTATATGKTVTIKAKNTSNVFVPMKGSYFLLDPDGAALDRGDLAERYLLQGDEGSIDLPLSANGFEKGTAVVTFDLDDGDMKVYEIDVAKQGDGYAVTAVRD